MPGVEHCKPNPCPIPPVTCCEPVAFGGGFGYNRYAFVLVLFILLAIIGAAFWW